MRGRPGLVRTVEGGRPYGVCGLQTVCGVDSIRGELRQVFPKEFAAVDHFPAPHVEQIDCQHAMFIVIAEDVGIVAFGGGDALALLQLFHRGNKIAIPGGALVLFGGGGLLHAGMQRTA